MAFIAPADDVETDAQFFVAPDDQISESYINTGEGPGTSAFNQGVRSLAKVGTGTVEGLAQLADLGVRTLTPQSWEGTVTAPFRGLASGAESVQEAIEREVPVNPAYAESPATKAAGVAGQVAGQLGSVLTGAAFTKAPKILQALGLGQSGALGLESGYEEADRLGVQGWQRDALAVSYAAAEAGVEGWSGFGTQPFIKGLLGEARELLTSGAVKKAAKTALGEGIEEPITGTLQAGASNVFAEEDPARPGFALNGQPLPSLDPTSPEFLSARGEEFALGAFGGSLFAGAQYLGSRPKVEQAKKLKEKVDLAVDILSQNPNPTPKEQADLAELQASKAELDTVIPQSEAALESTTMTAEVAGAEEPADAVDPDTALTAKVVAEEPQIETPDEITSEAPITQGDIETADSAEPGSEAAVELPSDLPAVEDTTASTEPAFVAPEDEVMPPEETMDVLPTPETPSDTVTLSEAQAEEAWLASPEFTQAEELAAAGDLEAAEALESSFRERLAQTPSQPENAPEAILQAQEQPPVPEDTQKAPKKAVAPPPVPAGLDPYWVSLGKGQTYSESDVRAELAETFEAERTQLQGVLGTADNKPKTLAKALKAFQPRTGGKTGLGYGSQMGGTRRDAVDEARDRDEGSVRSSLKGTQGSGTQTTVETARAAVDSQKGVIPAADDAWVGTRADLLTDPVVRREFVQNEMALDSSLTKEAANAMFDEYMANPNVEGFTFGGRTYIVADNVDITEKDGTLEGAIKRLLRHEDTHISIDTITQSNPKLKKEWEGLKKRVAAAKLDDLAERRYPAFADWRNDEQAFDSLVHEYFAEQMEYQELGQPVDDEDLLQKFIAFMRKVLARVMGRDVSIKEIREFVRAGRDARARAYQTESTARASQQPIFGELDIPEMPPGEPAFTDWIPIVDKQLAIDLAWRPFAVAWQANNPTGTTEEIYAAWAEEIADPESPAIAQGQTEAFMLARQRPEGHAVYSPEPTQTEPETSQIRFSKREQEGIEEQIEEWVYKHIDDPKSWENSAAARRYRQAKARVQAVDKIVDRDLWRDPERITKLLEIIDTPAITSAAALPLAEAEDIAEQRKQIDAIEEAEPVKWEAETGRLDVVEEAAEKRRDEFFDRVSLHKEKDEWVEGDLLKAFNDYHESPESIAQEAAEARARSLFPQPTRETSQIRFSLKPTYGSQSEERKAEYDEAVAAIPESGRDYVQFLGSLTRTPKITQAVRPMVDFARSLMGSYQGDEIEVNADNTQRVKELAAQAFQKGKAGAQFAEDISEQFRNSGFSDNGRRQGSVMAGVLQMEILDYAVRLAGEADKSLALALMPYANDVAAADHASLSNAGRALQMRSMAGQQKGFWTILNSLAKGERELAEKNPIYKELREALFSDEVQAETAAAVEKDLASEVGQRALDLGETPEDLLDTYLGRALGIMDQAERDITIKLFTDMAELEFLLARQEAMQAPKGAKASMKAARELNDPVAIQQRIDELKSSISKGLKALDKFKTSEASKETRKKALNKTPRAKKALSADAEAKKMLDRLENKEKRAKKEPAPWKKEFESQIKAPKTEAEFVDAMLSHGVSPALAAKLYTEAQKASREAQNAKEAAEQRKADQKETQAAVPEAKERVREQKRDMDRPGKIADQKSFINEVMRQIFDGTLEEQADPNWRRMVMVNAFKKAGFSQGSAENAADYLGSSLTRNLKQAQEKAAVKAAKDLNMKKPTLEKLVKAIRSKAIDPLNADPVTKALAAEAGFAGITPEQFTELAKLDGQMRGPYQSQRAKAAARMLDIALAAKPPKGRLDILTQAWISSALSSISTMSLSAVHAAFIPVRRLVTDFAGIAMDVSTGKTKPADAAQLMVNTMGNLQQAASYMLATAKFAGMNDAYTIHIVEFINQMHSMQADLQRAVQTLKDPNSSGAQKGLAAIKIAFTSTDIVRRILSTADETWGSMIQDFILRNEAMRTLVQKGNLTPTAAAMLFTKASNEGRIAAEKHLNETGNKVEAQLIARDATQNALLQAVRETVGDKAAEDVGTTANLESPMELGNRRSEDAPLWDIANTGLEWVKQLAIATRRKNELAGRMITGFVTVPANILNRSASFTPLGLARTLYKMKGNPEKTAKFYEETMKTEGQQRMRLIEGITGTLLITALLALTGGDDDEGLVITGSGPEDKGLREAWMKKGNQPNRIEWKDKNGNVRWSVPYARGGFDHLNLPFTLVATMDDMRLKGIKPKPANVEWGSQYVHTALKGLFDQAKFFGLKNVASMPTQNLTDKSLASQAAYLAAPVLPWSGLTKSLGRMWTGPTDQSSVRSAVLAQLPFTNFYATPSLNALGDQRGAAPTDARWEKSAMSGNPFLILAENKGPDADLYSMMIERGVAPNVPLRSNIERKNGFVTDQKWEQYLKTRGALIKQGIRKNLRALKLLPHKDAQNLIERISADSTRAAKAKVGLE